MIKLIIISVAGYLAYKVMKKKIRTMLFGQEQPKEINPDSSLIKCDVCEKYTDDKSVIHKSKGKFCSIECLESYTKKRG